jgi:[acyl-carrier-protein] S-malonyltransferase
MSGSPQVGSAAGVALAFPGQGGDWADTIDVLRAHADHALVAAVHEALDVSDLARLDPLDTGVAQPCVYAASVLSAGTYAGEPPVATIGHSLGEISALAVAGAIDPLAGLQLVLARAEAGRRQQAERPGAMVALMRVDATSIEWIRREAVASSGGVLDVAVVNGAEQVVLSGDPAAADAAYELGLEQEAAVHRLPIGGAYHSSLMLPMVAAFGQAVHAAPWSDPTVPVVSSTALRALTTADQIRSWLPRALVLPVRWLDALAVLPSLDVEVTGAVDVGPGRTLHNLARHDPVLPIAALRPKRKKTRGT